MSIDTGSRLGPYEILAPIGAGGMGEVYRARDTKLNRDVALKVLPALVAGDPDRLARFHREAQVLAALNHPNIAAIYGFEDTSDTHALVMELVEGPTLADRIAAQSARHAATGQGDSGLSIDEALPIAKQIADALEAAHEQGIVHRDLKPANIKVREDGTVKVLDFGLAKAMDDGGPAGTSGLSMSPTISIRATQAGVILGTAAYMSPEQAAGKPVDKRSDLWAFGVVLLEMLTGKRVFDGETISHVIAAVLKDAPDWNALPADTPAPIRKLLRRCLEKDRKKRLADASDARWEIEEALTPTEIVRLKPDATGEDANDREMVRRKPDTTVNTWKRRAAVIAGFAAGAVLAGAAVALLMGTRSERAATTGSLTYTPLSFEPGGNQTPVWSPDGKGVAFAASQRDVDASQVYVRYLDSSTSTQLTHMDLPSFPIRWTTAGRIVFGTRTPPAGLWSISQTGGQPESLLPISNQGDGRSADVSPNGDAIAYYGQQDGKYGVWISTPVGTPPTRYTPAPFEAETRLNSPKVRFSPNGKQILLLRNAGRGEEAWLMPYPANASHPPRQIFESLVRTASGTGDCSWMPDNRRVVLSLGSGGEPSRLYIADTVSGVFSQLSSGTTAELMPAVSPDGARLAFMEGINDYDVLQVDLRTGEVSPLVATRRGEDMPFWATKSAVMAYVTNRSGQREIWLHEQGRPDRPVVTALNFPPGTNPVFMSPAMSPDGARIIYERIDRDGGGAMWMSALSGGAAVRVTTGADASDRRSERPGSWSPDGAWFVYWLTRGLTTSVNRVRTTGQAEPEVLVPRLDGVGGNAVPVWSPTGEWILHNNNGWRLLSSDGKTERDLALQAAVCGFSQDASQLFCMRQDRGEGVLFSRPVAGGPEHVITRLRPDQVPANGLNPSLRMTLTPDGQHLTFSALKSETNLWLLDGIGK